MLLSGPHFKKSLTNNLVKLCTSYCVKFDCNSKFYEGTFFWRSIFAFVFLLCQDTGKSVTLLRLCKEGTQEIWKYQGRHHSHYKPIQDLLFGVDLDSNQPRLLSLGMDRRLVSPCFPVWSAPYVFNLLNCVKHITSMLSVLNRWSMICRTVVKMSCWFWVQIGSNRVLCPPPWYGILLWRPKTSSLQPPTCIRWSSSMLPPKCAGLQFSYWQNK